MTHQPPVSQPLVPPSVGAVAATATASAAAPLMNAAVDPLQAAVPFQVAGTPVALPTETTRPQLDQFAAWIRQQIQTSQPTATTLAHTTTCLCNLTGAMWCGVLEQSAENLLRVRAEHNGLQVNNLAVNRSSIQPSFSQAISQQKTIVSRLGPLTVIAAPLPSQNYFTDKAISAGSADALAIGLALDLSGAPAEPFLLAVQLAAAELGRCWDRDRLDRIQWQSQASAAMAELSSAIAKANDLPEAGRILTSELAKFLKCEQVVLGRKKSSDYSLKIVALSGQKRVGSGTKTTRAWREALQESCARHKQLDEHSTCVDIGDSTPNEQLMTIAHRQCLNDYVSAHPALHSQRTVITVPLVTVDGLRIGAIGCILNASLAAGIPLNDSGHASAASTKEQTRRARLFLETAAPHLASTLQLCERASHGALTRARQATQKLLSIRRSWITLATIVAVGAVLVCPIPYRVPASAVLSPNERSFAVAPYDGILECCLVKPGDVVQAGQTLARLDRVELEIRRADLVAQRQQAIKKRDVYRSTGEVTNMQIAACEEQQLQAQLELVDHRLGHLEILADANGVVLQSPMKDARNAPIKSGNILIEFAPLSKLNIELEVRETELPYLHAGQSIELVLHGQPLETLTAKVQRIHPQAEIRSGKNVLVAECALDNAEEQLRPGMRGEASIVADARPLGWILFHEAIEKVYQTIH